MSVLPIIITWDSVTQKIVDVQPDPARLTWLDKNVAQFVLESKHDDKARIKRIWFDGALADGPFHHLASTPHTHEKGWTGSDLIRKKETYKYSIEVEGKGGKSDILDPLMEVDDGP